MPAMNLMDRLANDLPQVLDGRMGPEDIFEWAATLMPVVNDCDCEGNGSLDMAVAFYGSLTCPDSDTTTTVSAVVPVECLEPGSLEEWVGEMWDALVLRRIEMSLESEDADTPGQVD